MRVTKVRDVMASIFAVILILALIAGFLLATGRRVPFLSDWLGR